MVKYRVEVYCMVNDLRGSVEVIAMTKAGAGSLALRTFFRGKGWQVAKVTQMEV